jgi:two-component system, NtrC family, response regulator PilR
MSRLLVVEDDTDVRVLMEEALVDAGYEVDVAGKVADARTLIGVRKYDLVITDGRLPDGHGLTVAKEARENRIPVLIVTGFAFDLPLEWPVLQKPVRLRDLVAAAKRVTA